MPICCERLHERRPPVVELAHEALLQHWPRVQQWLAEDREFLRARARVADAAALWRQEHQRADFLLAEGKPLADAQHLLDQHREDLEADLVNYVEASIKHRQRNRRRRILEVASVVTAFFTVVSIFSALFYHQWQ